MQPEHCLSSSMCVTSLTLNQVGVFWNGFVSLQNKHVAQSLSVLERAEVFWVDLKNHVGS